MSLFQVVFFIVFVSSAIAEVTRIFPCDESRADVCQVTEARIVPCERPDKCKLIKGTDAAISFDFIPNFTAEKLNTTVYWVSGANDVEFTGFGSNDACLYTSCPTEAGKSQKFAYTLHVQKLWPKGNFPLKWIVKNTANSDALCCFRVNIVLGKKK